MKTARNIILSLFIGMAIGAVTASLLADRACVSQNRVETDTQRVVLIDTLTYYQPQAKDSVITKYVTRLLPVVRTERDTIKETDSVLVSVPIESKTYEDSLYTAVVSGYNVNLDYIKVFNRTETTTITKTISVNPRKWSIGLQGGYGITPKGLQPYIGIGFTYKIY